MSPRHMCAAGAVASLTLCAITSAAWVIGHRDGFEAGRSWTETETAAGYTTATQSRTYAFEASGGRSIFVRVTDDAAYGSDDDVAPVRQSESSWYARWLAGGERFPLGSNLGAYQEWHGFAWVSARPEMGSHSREDIKAVVIPGWLLPLLSSIGPAGWLILGRRRTRANDRARCRNCAYDLTGNISGVCPECGTALYGASMR